MNINRNLEIAADKIAISEVVYKYCRAIDRLDRELLESVFHEDSIHHHSYGGRLLQLIR